MQDSQLHKAQTIDRVDQHAGQSATYGTDHRQSGPTCRTVSYIRHRPSTEWTNTQDSQLHKAQTIDRYTKRTNRFHVVELISLDGVQFLPEATFRTLFPHHSYVLKHAADDLRVYTPRHVSWRRQTQLRTQRYYYFYFKLFTASISHCFCC